MPLKYVVTKCLNNNDTISELSVKVSQSLEVTLLIIAKCVYDVEPKTRLHIIGVIFRTHITDLW